LSIKILEQLRNQDTLFIFLVQQDTLSLSKALIYHEIFLIYL